MATSTKVDVAPEPVGVSVTADTISIDLADGRTISVPLAWFPRLLHATPAERSNYELLREGIYWPDLNADVHVGGVLNGEKSGESLRSLKRWMDYRSRGEKEPIPEFPLPSDSQGNQST
jgi:hypothetical protein